jgi:hypothetical protein
MSSGGFLSFNGFHYLSGFMMNHSVAALIIMAMWVAMYLLASDE